MKSYHIVFLICFSLSALFSCTAPNSTEINTIPQSASSAADRFVFALIAGDIKDAKYVTDPAQHERLEQLMQKLEPFYPLELVSDLDTPVWTGSGHSITDDECTYSVDGKSYYVNSGSDLS